MTKESENSNEGLSDFSVRELKFYREPLEPFSGNKKTSKVSYREPDNVEHSIHTEGDPGEIE